MDDSVEIHKLRGEEGMQSSVSQRKINRRDFLRVAGGGLAGATLLGAAGCGGGGESGGGGGESGPLRIGAMLSSTGVYATLGESIKNGLDLFVEESGGEFGGRQVEVIYEDDEGDPQVALRKFRQLTGREQIDLLVTPISSSVALALVDPINQNEVLTINPNAAANALSLEERSRFIYRVSYSNYQLGTPGAAYIAENVGKKAVALAADYPAGQETVAAFTAAFEEAGGEVVQRILPPLGNADYATYLTQIRDAQPDVVWAFFAGADSVNFAEQYQSFGLQEDIPMTGCNTWSDPLLTEAVGQACEGFISATQYLPELENETNASFVDGYRQAYDETPNQFSVFGYDVGKTISQAIDQAGSTDQEAMIEALNGLSFQSPRGEITLDPETHNPVQNYVMARNVFQDGEIVPEVIEDIGSFGMPTENVPGMS